MKWDKFCWWPNVFRRLTFIILTLLSCKRNLLVTPAHALRDKFRCLCQKTKFWNQRQQTGVVDMIFFFSKTKAIWVEWRFSLVYFIVVKISNTTYNNFFVANGGWENRFSLSTKSKFEIIMNFNLSSSQSKYIFSRL